MSSIIFITFDIKKDEYPSMSYSIASMAASLLSSEQKVRHYSFDLEHALGKVTQISTQTSTITDIIAQGLKNNKQYFASFDYIAISLTAWTIAYCKVLLNLLDNYSGKIILGGYEVTSMSEDSLMRLFPRADYFIKGYAETALKKLVVENYLPASKIIAIEAQSKDLVSPYLSKVLNTFSKKLHWETKRGCPYNCGFCEWGNASKNVFEIDKGRILQEIELFRNSGISEINILDGTFNWGENYLYVFGKLLEINGLKITCQVRFEALFKNKGVDFFALCKKYSDRIHLEFGLQTIHPDEMETIGRKNNMGIIAEALSQLNTYNIDYEVSIIYAIPGQTIESFIGTIEFLLINGCRNIKAYPLRIPKNSVMEKRKDILKVKESIDNMNVSSVAASHSFSEEQKTDMDNIVTRLNSGELYKSQESLNIHSIIGKMEVQKRSEFLWEITSVSKIEINEALVDRVYSDYFSQTFYEIYREDFRQGWLWISKLDRFKTERSKSASDAIAKELYMHLDDWEVEENNIDPIIKKVLNKINPNIEPKKYFCKALISVSGNYYIFREVELKQ